MFGGFVPGANKLFLIFLAQGVLIVEGIQIAFGKIGLQRLQFLATKAVHR